MPCRLGVGCYVHLVAGHRPDHLPNFDPFQSNIHTLLRLLSLNTHFCIIYVKIQFVMSDSDSDDSEVQHVEPPHILERNQRNLRGRRSLIDIYNIVPVLTVAAIGEYFDTIPNGNCGYETLVIILFFAGLYDNMHFVRSRILQPGEPDRDFTSAERRSILPNIRRHLRRRINNVRWTLKNHFLQHFQVFRGGSHDPHAEVVTTAGTPMSEFQGELRHLRTDVANAIHRENVDYNDEDSTVHYSQWMRIQFWAIASHYYHLSFVVYQEDNRVQYRRTTIFRWVSDITKVIVYEYPREYMTPPFVDRFHCISFDTNHYQYVDRRYIPIRNGLSTIFNNVLNLAGVPITGTFRAPESLTRATFETARQGIADNPNRSLATWLHFDGMNITQLCNAVLEQAPLILQHYPGLFGSYNDEMWTRDDRMMIGLFSRGHTTGCIVDRALKELLNIFKSGGRDRFIRRWGANGIMYVNGDNDYDPVGNIMNIFNGMQHSAIESSVNESDEMSNVDDCIRGATLSNADGDVIMDFNSGNNDAVENNGDVDTNAVYSGEDDDVLDDNNGDVDMNASNSGNDDDTDNNGDVDITTSNSGNNDDVDGDGDVDMNVSRNNNDHDDDDAGRDDMDMDDDNDDQSNDHLQEAESHHREFPIVVGEPLQLDEDCCNCKKRIWPQLVKIKDPHDHESLTYGNEPEDRCLTCWTATNPVITSVFVTGATFEENLYALSAFLQPEEPIIEGWNAINCEKRLLVIQRIFSENSLPPVTAEHIVKRFACKKSNCHMCHMSNNESVSPVPFDPSNNFFEDNQEDALDSSNNFHHDEGMDLHLHDNEEASPGRFDSSNNLEHNEGAAPMHHHEHDGGSTSNARVTCLGLLRDGMFSPITVNVLRRQSSAAMSEDEGTDGIDEFMDHSPSPSVPSSLVPGIEPFDPGVSKAALDHLAGTFGTESGSLFVRFQTIGGRIRAIYKHASDWPTNRFTIQIERTKFDGKIIVHVNEDGDLTDLRPGPEWIGRGSDRVGVLRDAIDDAITRGELPAHINVKSNDVSFAKVPNQRKQTGKPGKTAKYPGSVTWFGACHHNDERTVQKNGNRCFHTERLLKSTEDETVDLSPEDNGCLCSTMVKAVLTMEEVIKLVRGTEKHVEVKLEYMNRCIHMKGEFKGRLQGDARKRKRNEVK